jgi:L-alanine-DL-glutamate epimerase-like enolase superfamily enzyme
MRLTRIVGCELSVPLTPLALRSAVYGEPGWELRRHTAIELHTDDGLVGYGGAAGTWEAALRAEAAALRGIDLATMPLAQPPGAAREGHLFLSYRDPWNAIREEEWEFHFPEPLEVALFDLLGKRYGVPAFVLLGGAYRTRVPVDFWTDRKTPEDAARACAAAQRLGFRSVKMKCALGDPLVEVVAAVRAACGPSFAITFDPNGRFYRPAEALKVANDLARLEHPVLIEDPFPRMTNLDWHVHFRQKSPLPLAIHAHTPQQVVDVIKREACDYLNFGAGMRAALQMGQLASAAGIPCWHGSNLDLAFRTASQLHVSAAVRLMVLPGDTAGPWIREDDLVREYYPLVDGHVELPWRPGYGLEPDPDAIDRYCQHRYAIDAA